MNKPQPDPFVSIAPLLAKPLKNNETGFSEIKKTGKQSDQNKKIGKQTDQTGKFRLFAWCLYDTGSTAFSTVIVTFVYAVYFARSVYGDPVQGSAVWSYALAAAGLIIAILAPLLGAAEDHYGAGRRFLRVFALLGIAVTAALYFIPPAPGALGTTGGIAAALGLIALGSVALELSLVFSNALLPLLAPPGWMGRLSGWAWACGYAGGLVCLGLALFGLVGLPGHAPLFDLPKGHAQNVRAAAPLVALWYLVFAAPLLLLAPTRPRTGLSLAAAIRRGAGDIGRTLHQARGHRDLLWFLIASALYRDGLNTLFAVGGLYAAGTYGLGLADILLFAIGLNVTAALGAVAFSFADDRIGSKRTILTSLVLLIIGGIAILFVQGKTAFIAVALGVGIFIGPVQAASRTLAARLAPPDAAGGTFGLYSLTGKASAFAGPLLFGLLTSLTGSQRVGMSGIVFFWLAGLALLIKVQEPEREKTA